ncbi:EcsC family protein [[Mycobacterium] crassicus]|uniref:EcsC family protein n=1 Tax=[Mycobacterium] crassicus TaxID=2872309 RepID=A0ABU5XMV2_9MYCO|nr:EcsC family protein [Mycolicibacter sp. MYC098]MEB3023610.1 EcsC family protein [Mycolicibacter sp. MYC098]
MASGVWPGNSDYERKAWNALLEAATGVESPGWFEGLSQGLMDRAQQVASQVRSGVEQLPGATAAIGAADQLTTKALETLHTVLVERGLNSVKPANVFAMFADEGIAVGSYDEIRQLDLKLCDGSVPRRKERYIALAVAEGAASSLAVTSAAVSSTVTGGATLTVAASAVVADVTVVMVGMGRIVALVAAHYGYDVREPDEQAFASGVIAYSVAGNSAEKAAALASLSRLTQQMMRQETWRHLQQRQATNVIQQVSMALGFRLAKRKLAQAVPLVGAVVNGGLNARIAHRTFERAQHAYRLRFLTEKHDLDAAQWAPDIVGDAVIDIPLIDEVLDAELVADSDGSSGGGQQTGDEDLQQP